MLAIGVIACVFVYYLLSRSLPEYERALAVDGLRAPVEIVRDNSNVPHIFGEEDEDIFFALGYAHAQDRLWQMMIMRQTVQGKLSEIFGRSTSDIDKLMRRLGLYKQAVESVSVQDIAVHSALESYSDGINARLSEINEKALGRGAPEMFMFGLKAIAPWQPADSIAIIKLMAMQLSGHVQNEVLHARLSLKLNDADRLKDILPDAPGNGIAEMPDYSSLFPEGAKFAAKADGFSSHAPAPYRKRALAGASNAWAAAPKRSAQGSALLASDPHLGFMAPTYWYLARLEFEAGGVIGGTIPGIPAILTGRSSHLGWAITSSYMDDQDVYIEKLNPENPAEYLTPQGYRGFRTDRSIINVNGGEPETITLRWTENGPVLSGSDYDLVHVTPKGHVASLAWTILTDKDTSMSAAIRLMRAKTIDEAIDAGRLFIGPTQNLMLVDQEGIAMKTIGAMPKRNINHVGQGRLPSLGADPRNRWQGYFDYSENPEFVDPDSGLLGTTNNKFTDGEFPLHVSHIWGDTQRIQRLRRLMQTRRVHTRESFKEAQLDTVSFTAQSLLPLVGKNQWYTGEAAPEGTRQRTRQRALELLSLWNGEMNEHLPEPLIYAAWMRALQNRLIRDDLGTLAEEFTHVEPLFIERVYRNIDGAEVWCDVRQSAIKESCEDMARLALGDALVWIEERYGDALESLRWGDAHKAVHRHTVFGSVDIPELVDFFNIRQSTSGGDNTLQRAGTAGEEPNPFENVHGAGYRGVYDFSDPDSSIFITSTGQSGHFLSRHYDDLGQLWRRGEYIPMSLDSNLARAASVGLTRLVRK